MDTNYCKGTSADKEDIIDFANMVFSMNDQPHNFKTLLPKLYSDRYNFSENHFLCRVDGKIKGLVLLDKVDLKVGKHTLKVGSIGTVSVHPYERGKGHMKKLMTEAVEEINRSCDLGELDGQRQRYEYFGFTPSGTEHVFTITSTNLRHSLLTTSLKGIVVERVFKGNSNDINAIQELCNASQLLCAREGEEQRFLDIMSSWNGELYALYKDDMISGYFYKYGSQLGEIFVSGKELLPSFIKEFMLKVGLKEITVKLNPLQSEYAGILSEFCEDVYSRCNHSFLPININKMITAFLELKAENTELEEGSIIISINNKTIKITLKNKIVEIEDSNGEAVVALCENEVMQELFCVNSNLGSKLSALPSFAKNWFPLPLFMSSVDVC